MRKIQLVIVLIVSVIICMGQNSSKVFDFSGMDTFWEILEYLEDDQEAPEELWEKLKNNPGYKTASEVEFGKNYFKYFYELAFMPSKKEDYEKRIARGDFFAPYLKHIHKVKNHKEELKAFQKQFNESPEIYKQAITKCKEYLPKDATENFKHPVISFIIFGPDGRGYEPILIDPLFYITEVNNKVNFLAHEFHHAYMRNYIIFREGEETLNWIFGQVYKEGIADLIDKTEDYYSENNMNSTERANKYRNLVEKTPQLIISVDSLLNDMYLHPKIFYKNAKLISKTVPMAGHTLGYYMTKNILKYGSKDDIINEFGNPYAFILRYNTIAIENNLPCFSVNSIKLFKELEFRYNSKNSR